MGAAGTVVGTRATVDEALHRVLPSVVALLRQATGREPLGVMRRDLAELKLSAPVSFPDGVGSGELVATIFAYRGKVRADFVLEHDRVLATPDGIRTTNRCFLNDFQASVTMELDAQALPRDFVLRALQGFKDALAAVQKHRKRSNATWGAIYVARSGNRMGARVARQHAARFQYGGASRPVATEWQDEDEDQEPNR